MRVDTLPSPGLLSMGIRLRTEMAKAISAVEINAASSAGGKTTLAASMATFLAACVTAVNLYKDTTAPTFTAKAIKVGDTTHIYLTASEALDPTSVPAITDFVLSKGTVTKVAVNNVTVTLTCSTAFAMADTVTVAYTKNTSNFLEDLSGNAVATFGAAAVTNNLTA